MKIRTDFVTNSSSSNYVTINMKSSKLTEIMCAARICKENGEAGWRGCIDRLDIDESEQTVKLMLEISNIISRTDEDIEDMEQTDEADLEYIGYPPKNLSGLSQSLIRLLKRVGKNCLYQNGYDLAKICSALEKNGDDISTDMESADWIYDMEGYGEANLFTWFWILSKYIAQKENLDYCPSSAGLSCSFHYDRENGESLQEEYGYSEPGEEDFTDDDLDVEIEFSEDDLEYEMGFLDEDKDGWLIEDEE